MPLSSARVLGGVCEGLEPTSWLGRGPRRPGQRQRRTEQEPNPERTSGSGTATALKTAREEGHSGVSCRPVARRPARNAPAAAAAAAATGELAAGSEEQPA